ncbi:sulfatase-like hydrolase/transferase [Sinomicrobium sp. FJxs]|uniref:Sulfatase-like hydrolase/transferase n=2 Tax=Sinomicrobium weinanense TaxID=2842200 RepID=A0A926Q4A6_9FLAO|nr:sulfatase-like hydrolase/transferase [Sinomicrobium weinanense]
MMPLVILFLIWADSFAQQDGDRPNILFIMTDQQTAAAMEVAGNSYLKTPNMNWLADHGVRFSRAYCPQPLCTPSRVSMFTGRMPHKTGVTINAGPGQELPARWEMLGKIVQKAGYKTGYVGKWHMPVNIANKEHHGFDYIENTTRSDWKDASIPSYAARFLKANKDRPFFLVTSFENPHDICEWARGEKLRSDELKNAPAPGECPPLPPNYAIPDHEPDIIRAQQVDFKTYPTVGWPEDRWRQYRWAYYRLVEKVDYYIGRVLESLRRNKLFDNTVIIFTSDHGDGNAAHQWNQKQVLYEESVRVPFIIAGPGVRRNTTADLLVNTGLDIFPTVCDFTGAQLPAGLRGISLRPGAVRDNTGISRSFTVSETEFALNDKSMGIRGRAIITGKYKYIVYDKGELKEQLFDLAGDPGEMNNLVFSEKHKKILSELRKQLTRWCEETGDEFDIAQILKE